VCTGFPSRNTDTCQEPQKPRDLRLHQTTKVAIKNRTMSSLITLLCFITLVSSHPIPQRLTEDQFRSFGVDGDVDLNEDNKVQISSAYSKIRHQGRNQNGRSISFNKPFTVRDPLEFAAAGQNLPQQNRQKIKKFPDMAPVFNLQAMLEAEAEKLRMKIEEASLMAAKAAEEAEEKVKMIAKQAMLESGASAMAEEEIEDIIEEIIDSAIDEAKEIFESKDTNTEVVEEETSTEVIPEEPVEPITDANSDAIFDDINEVDQEDEEETTETSEPSKDIDLGSVQEV